MARAYVPEEGRVTATLGPFLYRTDFHGSRTAATSTYLNGMGVIANGDINEKGSLEIAIFYMDKVFLREQARSFIAERTPTIHITMGYRRWVAPSLSASLAFYSAYSMSEPFLAYSDFPPGQEISTSAHDVTEYGVDTSILVEVWTSGRYAVVFDSRYAYSFTNKENEDGNHYGFLLGLRYTIQEKD